MPCFATGERRHPAGADFLQIGALISKDGSKYKRLFLDTRATPWWTVRLLAVYRALVQQEDVLLAWSTERCMRFVRYIRVYISHR